MMALSSSICAPLSTTKTKPMITMMIAIIISHIEESPSTSSAAYPMPWLASASMKSETRASWSASASITSASASVRRAADIVRSPNTMA